VRAIAGEVARREGVDEGEDPLARAAALTEGHEVGDGGLGPGLVGHRQRQGRGAARELAADAREDGHVGAAETIDGLLAIADEEEAVAEQPLRRRARCPKERVDAASSCSRRR
jgi:hypothetical protein